MMHTTAYKGIGWIHSTYNGNTTNHRAQYRDYYTVGDYKSLRAARAALSRWHKAKQQDQR